MDDVLEYTNNYGLLSAVRVDRIESITASKDGDTDAYTGVEYPAGTQSVIATGNEDLFSDQDSATLITRWKRQLGKVLSRG